VHDRPARISFVVVVVVSSYVQHLLKRDAAELWDLLEEGAYFYVCGATSMGNDVMSTMEEVVQSEGGRSAEDAQKYIKSMQAQHRYIQELWS